MNTFLDDALVGVLLLLSAAYVFSALGPRNLRRRVLAASSVFLKRTPAAFRLRGVAQRMAAAAEAKPAGACGGCDNCAAPTPTVGVDTEIKVPVANIGRLQR